MNKDAIITQALRKLGEREYQKGSEVYDTVNIFFDTVMRECNARHHWTFARRLNVPLQPKEDWHPWDDTDTAENEPERPEKRAQDNGRHIVTLGRTSWRYRKRHGVFIVPADCLRIMELTNSGGRKVDYWNLGVDVNTGDRIIDAPSEWQVWLTYTADLLQIGGAIPDYAPMYCNGVICQLASKLAPAMLGNDQLAASLAQEAEAYISEAILQDKRQDRSNDQHPWRTILQQDIFYETQVPVDIYP